MAMSMDVHSIDGGVDEPAGKTFCLVSARSTAPLRHSPGSKDHSSPSKGITP